MAGFNPLAGQPDMRLTPDQEAQFTEWAHATGRGSDLYDPKLRSAWLKNVWAPQDPGGIVEPGGITGIVRKPRDPNYGGIVEPGGITGLGGSAPYNFLSNGGRINAF